MSPVADDRLLNSIATSIVRAVQAQRVFLFGSRARGDHQPDSDYDLLVVVDDDTPVEAAEKAIHGAIRDCDVGVDVIVTTAAQYARRRGDVGTIEYAAAVEGRLLRGDATDQAPARLREPSPVPESFGEWMARAERDFLAMEVLMVDPKLTDVTTFHAHQCAEKYLKAATVFAGVQPPRTHLLRLVLARSTPPLREQTAVRTACDVLDHLWPKARYPRATPPTALEAADAIDAARVVRKYVRELTAPV